MVFVVGSPRSGTTFVGNSLGSQPGFVDLGEVPLLKAAVPRLVGRPRRGAGARGAADRRSSSATSGSSTGCAASSRTPRRATSSRRAARVSARRRPSTSSATAATSSARCSSAAGSAPVARARTTRSRPTARTRASGSSRSGGDEFEEASEATPGRVGVARATSPRRAAAPERTIELRYEALVADPACARPTRVAQALDADAGAARAPRSREVHADVGRPLAQGPDAGAARRHRGRGGRAARRARLHLSGGTLR